MVNWQFLNKENRFYRFKNVLPYPIFLQLHCTSFSQIARSLMRYKRLNEGSTFNAATSLQCVGSPSRVPTVVDKLDSMRGDACHSFPGFSRTIILREIPLNIDVAPAAESFHFFIVCRKFPAERSSHSHYTRGKMLQALECRT